MSSVNSFAASFADVIAAIEQRVREGVEQPATFTVPFQAQVSNYELPRQAFAITRVTGLQGGAFVIFRQSDDFTLAANRLVWVNDANRPDEGSRLTIEFTYREAPSGLTDFNPGSVVGTLVRAVAREMTLMYDQMDEAYRRAFIDHANGAALDNVVALLGVTRNPAQKATGTATFARRKPPTQSVVIARGTKIADASGRIFATLAEARLSAEAIEELLRATGVSITASNRIASVEGVWLCTQDPATDPSLAFQAKFGDNERTITLNAAPASSDLRVRYKPKSVSVAIEAFEPGPGGNVNAATVTFMPTPPAGIDSVTNESPVEGGQEAESDTRLRDRAKHALERAGNATLNALRFALLDVDGLEDVDVLDRSRDESIPLGEVRIRYSGGDRSEVVRIVEQTRAAGILARIDEVVTVFLTGTFFLIPGEPASPAAPAAFVEAVRESVAGLGIGKPLSVRKLNSLAFGIPGLADVAEAQLRCRKPDPNNPAVMVETDITDPLLTTSSELVRADPDRLRATVLASIRATASRLVNPAPAADVDIQLADAGGSAVTFRNFSLNVQVTLRARLTARPDAPAERIGSFTRAVTFTNNATATMRIAAADLAGLRAEHAAQVEVQIAPATFPALASATRAVQVRP